MLAYSYLKSNPKANAYRIALAWADLFKDPDCPYGVKQELLELQALTTDMSDAVLYFHEQDTLCRFIMKDYKAPREDTWHSPWLKHLYERGVCTGYEKPALALFGVIAYIDHVLLHDLPSAVFDRILQYVNNLCNTDQIGTGGSAELYGIVGEALTSSTDLPRRFRTIGDRDWLQLFQYLDLTFIMSTTQDRLRQCLELLADTPMPPMNQRYKSLSEVQRAHDARTEREIQEKMAACKGKSLKYLPELEALVKKSGYTLPRNKAEFIQRGDRHHNCVATYYDRHIRNCTNQECRILLGPTATAELCVYTAYEMIVAVRIVQHKGQNNKDIDIPLSLYELAIELTGKPEALFYVSEVKDDQVHDQ